MRYLHVQDVHSIAATVLGSFRDDEIESEEIQWENDESDAVQITVKSPLEARINGKI